MDEKNGFEISDVLLHALESAKSYGQRLEQKRERRLWKNIDMPCSLSAAINRLTKNEMDKIRKNLGLKNLSALKKGDLADELVRVIPAHFGQLFYRLDRGMCDLVRAAARNSGFVPSEGITTDQVASLMGYGLLFPGVYDRQRVLFLPAELADVFSRADGKELINVVRRNTRWVRLTHGMAYYYGVANTWFVQERIEQLTGNEVDFLELFDVVSIASDFYDQVRLSPYGLADTRVFDAEKVVAEQNKRPGVDYYPFSKRELLIAGEPGYIDRPPAMNRIIDYLSEHYSLTGEDLDEISFQLTGIINMEANPIEGVKYLLGMLEFSSFEVVQQLTDQFMDLHNNTRQWVLKGHTPNELFQEEKKHLRPLPAEPFKFVPKNAEVIDIKTRKKIGRNDPCPCGSGKKFKRCCGK
ncbi:MAG: SEC-C metal-binding domain-containing protein [Desulfotomaculaceae bacterium]|nr:SEC-C metal-binding domain-containing protein [Desulfotomaculaceae bacterium]